MVQQLAPVSPPLGISPSHSRPVQTTLVMKEKVWSLSGDSFHIVDQNGVEVVQCRGQSMSLSGRKEFADASGRPLFSLRARILSLHKSFYAEAANGDILFEVEGKFSLTSSKMFVTFTNAATNTPVELLVKGDWLDRRAAITMSGSGGKDIVVAEIARDFGNMREIFGGQQTYYVSVVPGVDLVMMAAICVCLDEKENEGGGSWGL